MDIEYEVYGGTSDPTSEQITVSSVTFTDNKSNGQGGLMRINVENIMMSVTSSTFTTHSAGTYGGVFYIESLKKLTMTGITATDFDAPATGGGRFIYYNGNVATTIITSTSTFTCS